MLGQHLPSRSTLDSHMLAVGGCSSGNGPAVGRELAMRVSVGAPDCQDGSSCVTGGIIQPQRTGGATTGYHYPRESQTLEGRS
jgi:hypothetical protein